MKKRGRHSSGSSRSNGKSNGKGKRIVVDMCSEGEQEEDEEEYFDADDMFDDEALEGSEDEEEDEDDEEEEEDDDEDDDAGMYINQRTWSPSSDSETYDEDQDPFYHPNVSTCMCVEMYVCTYIPAALVPVLALLCLVIVLYCSCCHSVVLF